MQSFKSRVIVLMCLLAFCLALLSLLLSRNSKTLQDLDRISGNIEIARFFWVNNPKTGKDKVLGLKFPQSDLWFGVHEKYGWIVNNFEPNKLRNKFVTVYYDGNGFNGDHSNLTLHLYQVEVEEKVLLELNDSRFVDRLGIKVLSGLLTFIALGFGILIWKKRTGRIQ